jgi:hypothetical protein
VKTLTSISDVTSADQPAGGPNTNTSDWYPIETVLRHERTKVQDMYLVKWKGQDSTSWIVRKDLSEATLRLFLATRRHRYRRSRSSSSFQTTHSRR